MQSDNNSTYAELEIPPEECMTFGKLTNRGYQQFAFNKIIEHVKTSTDPAVCVASVGAGKTVIIAALAKHVTDKGGKVLVLSRQGEIIFQDSQDAWLAECKNSIYSASLGIKSTAYPAIFGSEGSVFRSLEKDMLYCGIIESTEPPAEPSKLYDFVADLIMIDEAHMVNFEEPDSQYMKIIAEIQRRNPKVRIIGLTGTDFRGVKPIIGETDFYFWKKRLTNISTEYLTNKEFLVPCSFGFGSGESSYDLSEFRSEGNLGTQDYTLEQMRKMERLMLKAETTTEKIMFEVIEKAKTRNCVLITCAGKKHCKEAARFLPEGSYAIITEEMSTKKRKEALDLAFDGKLKYLLQIGCLTTGVNIPLIDTIVILRKIGSLTLLVQLIGRGLRLLKDFQEDAGIIKNDCLVLDYSDTLSELKDLYDNPILENADFSKAKDEHELIMCPRCGTENSKFAVRCRGESGGVRCDFFWKSRICEPFYINGRLVDSGCGTENAPTARQCRNCDNTLIDPNANLSRKHYSSKDYKPLLKFDMKPTKNNGVLVEYHMPNDEVASIFYTPFSTNQVAKRIWYNKFVKNHANTPELKKKVRAMRNAGEMCSIKSQLDTIAAITHRRNDKGESVITKFIKKD